MYNLLIVDDEPFIYQGLQNLMDWNEYGVTLCPPCYDGRSALAYLESHPVELLLVDIQMPGMTGLELLSAVREQEYPVHCMVLSGYDDFAYVKGAAQLGIENYFLKPIDLTEFSHTLSNVILKIQQQKQLEAEDSKRNSLLKENFLKLWLTNNIEPNQLQEKADITGVDIAGLSYCAAVMKLFPPSGNWQVIQKLPSICHDLDAAMKKKHLGLCTITAFNEITLIFISPRHPLHYDGLRILLQGYEQLTWETYGLMSCVGVGEIRGDRQNIFRSYRQAKRIIQCFFTPPAHSVQVFMTDLRANTPQYLSPATQQNIRLCIISHNWDGIQNILYSALPEPGQPEKLQAAFFQLMLPLLDDLEFSSLSLDSSAALSSLSLTELCRSKSAFLHAVSQILSALGTSSSASAGDHYVARMKNYVAEHYGEAVSLQQIAGLLQVSPSYLGQLFLQESHISFSNYLNDYRIQKAKTLLRHTDLRIADISSFTGFSSSNYFNTIFRKMEGRTPKEYREQTEKQ